MVSKFLERTHKLMHLLNLY